MRKPIAILLALVLALSTVAVCAGCQQVVERRVYYLNFKQEQDEQWQKLAAEYSEKHGIEVVVKTAPDGQYEQTLAQAMSGTDAPTLFQVNGPVGLEKWKNYCYDLSGSKIYSHLTSDDFALKEGDAVYGIAYVIETYGIIVNKPLLEMAGYTTEDIASFADLKAVAEDITARKEELGFAAFTSSGMDSTSDWRFKTHLANLPIYFEYQDAGIADTDAIQGTYLDAYRNVWDLYLNNSTCSGVDLTTLGRSDACNEFMNNQAVFYQNGSWEYSVLSQVFEDEELEMIPLYTGVGDEANQGLCTGTENYWCVNKNASAEDIEATLDFIEWCTTSNIGSRSLAEDMDFVIPFDTAAESGNLFMRQEAELVEEGKNRVNWSFLTIPSDEWKTQLAVALTAYAAEPTDEKWQAVEAAFIENWAKESQ